MKQHPAATVHVLGRKDPPNVKTVAVLTAAQQVALNHIIAAAKYANEIAGPDFTQRQLYAVAREYLMRSQNGKR